MKLPSDNKKGEWWESTQGVAEINPEATRLFYQEIHDSGHDIPLSALIQHRQFPEDGERCENFHQPYFKASNGLLKNEPLLCSQRIPMGSRLRYYLTLRNRAVIRAALQTPPALP
jgi:hypothetical protein